MNIKALENELLLALDKAEELREKAELENATADFLKKECGKLEERANGDILNDEEREILRKQMSAMHRKLILEVANIEAGIPELNKLEDKINNLAEQIMKVTKE